MKKILNVLAIVIFIAAMVFNILETNAELWGISASAIAIGSSVLFALIQVYDNLKLFSESDMIDFGEYMQGDSSALRHSVDCEVALKEWKTKRNR